MSKPTKKQAKTSAWVRRHTDDTYVKQAVKSGYRARAVYKLEQVDRQYRLLKPGKCVIDLGAAPGSWSQYAVEKVGATGQVIAIDLLPMKAIVNVEFIQGNFCDPSHQQAIISLMRGRQADVLLSDMAADLTGIRITDQANMENLIQSVLQVLPTLLRPGGHFLLKVFEGEAVSSLRKSLKLLFNKVISINPDASRRQSKELYLLAQNYRPNTHLI